MIRAVAVIVLVIYAFPLAADELDKLAERATAEWKKNGLHVPSGKHFRQGYQWSLEDARKRGLARTGLTEQRLESETFKCLASEASTAADFAKRGNLASKPDGLARVIHYTITACLEYVVKFKR